ncbi:MAG: esterase/lipase family protein, partial [Polyangiales bacterium]
MRRIAPTFACLLVACGGGGTAGGEGDAGRDAALPADAATDAAADADPLPEDAATDAAPDSGDSGPERLGPPYPVVLAHGFFGFDEFAGADFATYYYEVKDDLDARGEPLVFTPAVDPFNDSTARGMQLLEKVEAILEETGHAKANLIGHSQGGLDARVVAHERPDLVASVTSIATPHGGTPISDIVLRLVDNDDFAAVVDALVRVIGAPIYDEVGEETSVVEGLAQFSEPGIQELNDTYTDQPDVAYYSIAGRTDYHPGGAPCEGEDRPELITRWDDQRDPVDPLLDIT